MEPYFEARVLSDAHSVGGPEVMGQRLSVSLQAHRQPHQVMNWSSDIGELQRLLAFCDDVRRTSEQRWEHHVCGRLLDVALLSRD